MTDEIYGSLVSPQDHDLLRELIHWYKNIKNRLPKMFPGLPLPQSPDSYLARCTSVIPAMSVDVGTDTGSAVGRISKADCSLYRIDDRDPDIDVDPIGIVRPVYNPSTTAIQANTLFLVTRTADGKFVAVQGGGGSSSTIVFSGPANDGARPPKPKLDSRAEVDYNLATDTVYLTGVKYWGRNMNL